MTVSQALKAYPAKIETELLLAHILKRPKEFLYTNPRDGLTATQEKKFKSLVKKRAAGVPIAYLVGYKYFCGLRFKVNKNVLIPRPETEWIVEQALKYAKPGSKIIDLGTGSGCIAISIRKNAKFSRVHVWASDISAKALQVAKTNARDLKAKVRFYRSDLFQNVSTQFDIVIANLPYVPLSDYRKLKKDLGHEPKTALTDGTPNFEIYQRLFAQVETHIRLGSVILLEIDPLAVPFIKSYVKKYLPGRKINFHKDLNSLIRYAVVK